MKHLISLTFLTIFGLIHAQIPSYVPSTGLIGWWPFNGNANDESGNGNNGTVNGATLTTDRNNISNAAYSFGGNNVLIPLNQTIVNMPSRTISLWFNSSTPQSGGRLFETTSYSWGIGCYNSTQFDCWYQKSNKAYNSINLNFGGHNTWHNLVYVCDSVTGNVKVYLNGVNVHSSIAVSHPGNPISWLNHFIKVGQGNSNESFIGKIDDIALWNRSLTPTEITNLYNSINTPAPTVSVSPASTTICPGTPTTLTASTSGSTACSSSGLPTSLQTGLVGYWPFCGNANDASGNGNNGTVNGAALTNDRFGNASSAYSFDGVDDYIQIGSANLPYSNSDRTISIWIYKQNNNSPWSHTALAYGSASQSNAVMIGISGSNNIAIQGWSNDISTNQLTSNSWENIIFSINQGVGNVYYNGILIATQSIQNWNTLQSVFYAGTRCDMLNSYFYGLIDDIAIWNRALTASEIQQLYSTSNATYSWSPGGATTPSITVSPNATTTYTVTATANGQSSTSTAVVTVTTPPTITASSSSICAGQSATLTAAVTGTIPTTPCSGLTGSLSSGLVGYWPFCGNANDASGNGYNGTVNGATLTTDRFGVSNSAYFFDHSNEIVTNCTAISNDAPRTISFWMKNQYGNKTISPIWYGGNPTTPIIGSGFNIIFNRNEQSDQCGCWPGTYEGIGVTTDWIYVLKQAVVGDNLWHNWVVVVENIGSNFNQINYYKDGVLITSNQIFNYNNNGSTPINTLNQSPLKFGKSTGTSSNPDKAPTQYLDDIGIWNRALTVAEIQQLYAMGQTTYSWSPVGATTPSITVSPSSTTTYTCSVTTNGSTCSSNQVITVNAIPTVNAGLDQSVCTGSNVILSATGATTYAWSGGVQNGVAFAPTSSGTYTVTGTSNGCSATDAVQVTVNPLPTANAGADFTKTCVTNPSGTLVGMTSVAGNTYTWTPATGLSSAGAANPTANPTANTTYTLTATNTASGCTATDQVLVTVNTALPTANAGADFTKTCVTNPSGTLVGMSSVAGNTYAWTPATGLSSVGAANPTANPTATTTYTLIATNMASGCTATDQVLVTVNTALPTVNAGLDQTLCQGVSTVLNASSNGATLSWNNGAQNNISFVPSTVGTTTYTATATGSNGCTANDNMVVTVNPLPSAAVTTNGSSSFCPGSSVQLCAPTGTGYSYLWSGNLGTTQCVTISSSATTSVTVTNGFNCSATSAPQQVTVFNNPLASAGLDATITCVQNASGAQIGAVPNPTYTYSWTPASGLSSATIGNPIANPSTTTTYTLTVVNADGCMGSDQVTVTVNNTPPTANAGLDQSICLGASLALQGSTNGASGTWNNGVTNGIPFTPSQTGTAAYTYSTVGANGCVNNDQVSVTVNALPVANAGQGGVITCVQNVNGIQLGAGPSSGNTYAWTPTSGLNNSNTANPTATPTASTTYTLLMSDANGCSDTAQVVVTVNNNPPIVSAGNDANVCNGDSLYLFANTTAGSTVVWNGTIQNGSNVLPTQSGYQVATATAANGCTSQDSLMATILQPTTSTLNEVACDEFVLNGNIYLQTGTYTQLLTNTAGCDSTITLNLTLNLSPATPVVYVQNEVNLSTDVVPGQTYQWIYCSDLVNVPGATNPTFNPTANAIYAVVVTNNCGSDTSSCTTVSTIGLADNEQPEIAIYPNPNNGHFTILLPKNNGSAKLEVLDLNGRIIFESTLDQQSNELHLETLSSGTYWLRINQQIPVPVTKY